MTWCWNNNSVLCPDPSEADSSTVSDETSQIEFHSATNKRIFSLEAIQANSGKGNKQSVKRFEKSGHKKKIGQQWNAITVANQKLMYVNNE